MIRHLWHWLTGRGPLHISPDLLRDYARAEMREGWTGPRWRTPKEVAQLTDRQGG